MQPYEHTLAAAPVDPLAQLLALVDEAVAAAAHLGFGLALGVAAVAIMRRRHLRWTWGMVPLAVALPAHALLGGWTMTVASASLAACARGHRRHREDIAAGGDLAQIARARRGPALACRVLALRVRARFGGSPRTGALHRGRMAVGRDEAARAVSIPFGASGGSHTLIVGATGSGKTVTQTWIACRAVEAGYAAVVVDPKGDARMRTHLAQAARDVGRPFLEWTPAGPWVYNPFGHGGASEIADKALAGERFTEPHYQRQAQRYLGHAVRTLRDAGATVSVSTLVEHLQPERLAALASGLPDERQARATLDYLDSLTTRQAADLAGVRDRLAILAEADVGRWLDPEASGPDRRGSDWQDPVAQGWDVEDAAGEDAAREEAVAEEEGVEEEHVGAFDLLSAIRARAVVYFALKADARPLLAQMLGTAIVVDLRSATSALQDDPVPAVVAIDEFAALAAEQVSHLFGRARSAGINLLLGTQELSDLRLDGSSRLLDQVTGNLSALVAHRQSVVASAELVSRLAGTRGDWRTTYGSDGRWTRSRTTSPVIAAEEIRGLPAGYALVSELGLGEEARIAHVFSSVCR